MPYQGHKGKITLGETVCVYLNSWSAPGIVNQMIESTRLLDEYMRFEYGAANGGSIDLAGFFHTAVADPVEAIDPAQELLRGYAESKAAVPKLRLYYGTGDTQFYHATPGAVVRVENYKVGPVDKQTGLVGISFRLVVSDGYMSRVVGYYNGTDVSFAHVVGANNDTISKTGGTNFAGLGFVAGADLVVEGSTSNDLSLEIAAGGVAADVLTLASDTLTTEIAGDDVSLISFPIV